MYQIINSTKDFAATAEALTAAVPEQGFGLLHVHDLGETLRTKGQDFTEECRIFEVCNPAFAAKVLAVDLRLNMALPCRISVYTEKGVTKVGYIDPGAMLGMLSDDESLRAVADDVSKRIEAMARAAVG